ncbi:TIGR04197 family type VII secretion effector [Streptococcus sp. 2A/TPW/M5]
MTPIQSREEVASSIASGIASAAGSITSADTVTLDGSSEYPGNSTAAEKFQRKPTMQPQLVVC